MQADRCLSLRKKIVIYVQHAACISLKIKQIEFYLVLDTILRFNYSVSTLDHTVGRAQSYPCVTRGIRQIGGTMKQAIGYTLLIVGTFAAVGYLAVTLVTDYPVTTGIFAAVVLGTVLLEKR